MRRREFCWSALAAGAPAVLWSSAARSDDADPLIVSLRAAYAALTSYTDVIHVASEASGRSWIGEVRTAFVRPNRLCSQVSLFGNTETVVIIDGGSIKEWSAKRGWSGPLSLGAALAGLQGANRLYGSMGHLIALLLLAESSGEAPALSTMTNVVCTQKQARCLMWEGTSGTSGNRKRSFTLDPATGLIRKFTCVDANVRAAGLIDCRVDALLNMDAVVAALTRAPDQPMSWDAY
ncbi:MAG: hypothetical protein ABI769_04000 [Pseudomonadota bacterium]